MRISSSAIVVMAGLALAACAAEKRNVSTVTITAAELSSRPSPAPPALRVNPERSIDLAAPLEGWRGRYPQAAQVLDEWVARYPDAAPRIVAWSVDDPDQLEVLVMWAVSSPTESLQTFLVDRRGWTTLRTLHHEHPIAVDAFVHWVRRARPAAEELALRPGGLAVAASTNVVAANAPANP